jgi:signal peptidase II
MTTLATRRAGLTRLAGAAYGLAVLAIVLDQLSKAWVLQGLHLAEGGPIRLLPILSLNLVWNRGFSFGLLSQVELARWGLFVFSLGVALALALWVRRAQRWPTALAIGLIIGGAVGNAIDRVRFGAVVDFIDVSGLGFFPWIFNVADSCISVGVAILVLDSLFAKPEPKA